MAETRSQKPIEFFFYCEKLAEKHYPEAHRLMQILYPDLPYDEFLHRLKRQLAQTYLVMNGDDVLGLFSLSRFVNMIAGDVAYLEEMVIAPEYQGAGLGRKVVEHILSQLKQEGRVSLYTDDSTPQGSRHGFLNGCGAKKVSNFYEFTVN
ncbi:MAG: GNAT family N-acetyltransferase [Dongiaceae bacterium]